MRSSPSRSFPQPTRRGATSVEFAFVAPILFAILLGMIELSRGLMVQHLITKAARQGCRLAVIEGKSNADVKAAVTNALASVGISSETITVQINDVTADASTANAGDEVTVIVSVPANSVSWVPFPNFLSGNLSGRYTLRRE
jgi:Flp pilus assembly protein TadG